MIISMLNKSVLLAFLVVSGLLLTGDFVHATVGGPSYIRDLRYSPEQASESSSLVSIFYRKDDYGGRGCPPEYFALSASTGRKNLVITCAEAENTPEIYEERVDSLLDYYNTSLDRISLTKNNITASVELVNTVPINETEGEYWGYSNFILDVFQDGVRKTSIPFSGCKQDQPHILKGYAAPTDNALILLLSSVPDCFEGGYISEEVYLVPAVSIIDRTVLPPRSTEGAAFEEGNLRVYANTPIKQPSSKDPALFDNLVYLLICPKTIIGVLTAAILGLLIYIIKLKKRVESNEAAHQ